MRPLIEIISDKVIFELDQQDEAEKYIKNMLIMKNNIGRNILFLDFHGVTDTLGEEGLSVLKKSPALKIVVSFIGHTSSMRNIAKGAVQKLLDDGIIDFCFLVFTRKGKRKNKEHRPIDLRAGTKFWIINEICKICKPEKSLFLDDAEDHVRSVSNVKGGLISELHNPDEENILIEKINKAL